MESQRKKEDAKPRSGVSPGDPRRRLDGLIRAERADVEPTLADRDGVWSALRGRLGQADGDPVAAVGSSPPEPPEPAVLRAVPPPTSRAANRRPHRATWASLTKAAAIVALVGGTILGLSLWRAHDEGGASIGKILVDLNAAHVARARAEALVVDQSQLISEYAREHEVATYEVVLAEEPPDEPPTGRSSARLLWRQGLAAYVDGDHAAASEFYDKALAEDPTFANALSSAGRVAAENGDLDAAASRFRKALKHQPKYRPAMVNLATILIMRRELDEAERLIERALATQPNDPVAQRRLERIRRLRNRVVNPKKR